MEFQLSHKVFHKLILPTDRIPVVVLQRPERHYIRPRIAHLPQRTKTHGTNAQEQEEATSRKLGQKYHRLRHMIGLLLMIYCLQIMSSELAAPHNDSAGL